MGHFRRVFFVLAALEFFTAFSGPARAADADRTLSREGAVRDYIVHTPPQYDAAGGAALPVIVALHGGGGSARGMQAMYNLDSYADRYGYITVYPDGVPAAAGRFHTWNAGGCCGKAKKDNADDSGFIAAVIDAVVKEFHADAKRVFATGHSNGAMMAYRLACDIPGKLAAIAAVSGQDSYSCPLVTPVPVLHIHGTLDMCALYDGGECGGCFGHALGIPVDSHWACESVRPSLARRALAYGCRAETKEVLKNGPVTCETWQGCPERGAVALCTVSGGGHHWQGSGQPPFCGEHKGRMANQLCQRWQSETGPMLNGVDTNAIIFGFFGKH